MTDLSPQDRSGSLPGTIVTDVVIVGAGPAGLYQVFQLGLLELRAELVDALPGPGGQVRELYADKPIYDIPALPLCTGHGLVEALVRQMQPFRPGQHWNQQVTEVQPLDEGGFLVLTSAGTRLQARAVVIAAGVGAFLPRRLAVAALMPHEHTQVFHLELPDGLTLAGRHLVVAGGDEMALQQALQLSRSDAASVTLLHRRSVYNASDTQVAQVQAAAAAGRLRLLAGQITGVRTSGESDGSTSGAGTLTAVSVLDAQGEDVHLPLDLLLVCQGLHARLGPLADWGLALERKHLPVDPATMATNVPGIHAIGDVVSYPGKKKLILCGFHEATMAAFAIATHCRGGQAPLLQYTSSSSRLQQLLGVTPTA